MAAPDRSLSDVFQDIVRNVQDIVRSEVRLAKIEIGQEAAKAKSPVLLLGAGVVTALFAMLFLLLTIVDALALVMPRWAAALSLGATLTVVASVILTAGVQGFKHIRATPVRTIATIKENVEWAQPRTK